MKIRCFASVIVVGLDFGFAGVDFAGGDEGDESQRRSVLCAM